MLDLEHIPMMLLAVATVGLLVALAVRTRLSMRNDDRLRPADLGITRLGERATAVQFSGADTLQRRDSQRVLTTICAETAGMTLVELDADAHADLAHRLRIHATPTTILVGPDGAVQARFGGTPARGVVELELARIEAAAVPLGRGGV